jgi:hypothetical protein
VRLTVLSSGVVWAINSANHIYSHAADPNAGVWTEITGTFVEDGSPACATDIAASADGSVWIVTCTPDTIGGGGGFKVAKFGLNGWTRGAGETHAKRIAVGPDGRPFIVNSLDDVWVRSSTDPGTAGWFQGQNYTLKARDIAISSDYILYGTGTNGGVFIRDDQDALAGLDTGSVHQWIQLIGAFAESIGAGSARNVWVTNTSKQIYQQTTGPSVIH